MADKKELWTVGRRKTSVARAKISNGNGTIIVNKKAILDYMHGDQGRVNEAIAPLLLTELKDKFNLLINVKGGGPSGQVGAIRHAIARAVAMQNPDTRSMIKKEGFLTRDARMVERKKYGLHKARKGTQFSKR